MNVLNYLVKYISKFFTLWIIFFAVVAYIHPQTCAGLGWTMPYVMGTIMLSMGLTMTPTDFKAVFTRPWDVLLGILLIYGCMPLVGLLLGRVFDLPIMLGVGLVLLGASPTGTTSNVMTFLSRGDTALTVTISSVNTLLAPVLTPLLMLYYAGQYITIDFFGLFFSILQIVIIPIILGLFIRTCCKRYLPVILKVVPLISMICMAICISVIVSVNAATLTGITMLAVIAFLLYTVIGTAIGYSVSRVLKLPLDKRKSLSFTTGIQNTALAATLALQYFDPMAAIPGAFIIVWASVFTSLVVGLWMKQGNQKAIIVTKN